MPVADLIVEDGSGVVDADAYVSVDNADRYFEDRGVAAWAALSADKKKIAIRRATDFIEEQYGEEFAGERAFPLVQSLSFPRDLTGILPVNLVRATLELALLASEGDLYVDGANVTTNNVVEKRTKIGPIEKSERYGDIKVFDMSRPTIAVSRIDALLSSFMVRPTMFIPVVRA